MVSSIDPVERYQAQCIQDQEQCSASPLKMEGSSPLDLPITEVTGVPLSE